MKKEMAVLSVQIAEKILRQKLSSDKEQQALVEKLVDDIDLN
jgi:F-type H+-transporting ATPase subunit b